MVDDCDFAAAVAGEPGALQLAGRFADLGAAVAQHRCEKLLRQRQHNGTQSLPITSQRTLRCRSDERSLCREAVPAGLPLGLTTHWFDTLRTRFLHALLRSLFHQHKLHLSDVYRLCRNNAGYIFLKNDGFVFYQTK